MAKQKTAIILAGPTASGKTSFAIQLAKHFNTEIISADSRQCYKEMKIGVARPTEEELAEVKHHFIASHSIHNEVTAVTFENYALEKAEEIFQRSDVVIVTGGTGLYIKAFLEGLDEIPAIPADLRNNLRNAFEEKGISWLQQEIKKQDPLFYETGETENPHRMLRALEVKKHTGKSIIEYRKGNKAQRNFSSIKLALDLPREILYDRINKRVDTMIAAGLVDEVRSLYPFRSLKALQTVGYDELFDFLEGKIRLDEAVNLIRTNTRHYAKRQLTWFRNQSYHWMDPRISTVKDVVELMVFR